MAKRRRTSGIQRQRASAEAMNRRIDQGGSVGLPDWRLLLIGGVLVIGVLLLALVLLFGGGPAENVGVQHPDDGGTHVADGTDCRSQPDVCGPNPYSSLPATSGPHWGTPAAWGVYTTPLPESQAIHNLEHGGIVIWYDPAALTVENIDALANHVETQNASGISGRYKFILSPWGGSEPLPAPVVATAWRWSLELQTADIDAIDEFARAHYGRSPEPNGGPGPPG
jgi:Protein of unknown function (DUF3105)